MVVLVRVKTKVTKKMMLRKTLMVTQTEKTIKMPKDL